MMINDVQKWKGQIEELFKTKIEELERESGCVVANIELIKKAPGNGPSIIVAVKINLTI